MRKPIAFITSTLITLCAASQLASATPDPYIATSKEKGPKERRLAFQFGLLAGNSDVGDVKGPGVGLQIAAGPRFGPVTLLAEYDYFSIGESTEVSDARRGNMSRLGGLVRYALLDTAVNDDKSFGPQMWIEAGGGWQRVFWNEGGRLDRPDVVFGFGVTLDKTLGKKSSSPRYIGPYFAVRGNWAQAPDMDDTPTCGGPCDKATSPSRNDVTFSFNFGLDWGR